jgi:predicted 3-demethylubiquinone-9 3-methyltransferase (glyoxalase superfamily)
VANIQKITPFLWLDGRAREAAEIYTSIFEGSGVISASRLQADPGAGARIISF